MYVGMYVHTCTYIGRRRSVPASLRSAVARQQIHRYIIHTYLNFFASYLCRQMNVGMQICSQLLCVGAIIYVPTYIPMYTHRVSKGGISFAHLNNVEVPFILLPALICGSYIPTTYMTYQPSGRRIPFQKFTYSIFYIINVLWSLLKKRSATVRTLFNAHATVTRSTCIPTYLSIYVIRNLS